MDQYAFDYDEFWTAMAAQPQHPNPTDSIISCFVDALLAIAIMIAVAIVLYKAVTP